MPNAAFVTPAPKLPTLPDRVFTNTFTGQLDVIEAGLTAPLAIFGKYYDDNDGQLSTLVPSVTRKKRHAPPMKREPSPTSVAAAINSTDSKKRSSGPPTVGLVPTASLLPCMQNTTMLITMTGFHYTKHDCTLSHHTLTYPQTNSK